MNSDLRITPEMLEAWGSYADQLAAVCDEWSAGMKLNEANLQRAVALELDLDWLFEHLLTDAAWVTYREATNSSWATFTNVTDAAQATYDKGGGGVRVTYSKAMDAAWTIHSQAIIPIFLNLYSDPANRRPMAVLA